MKVKTARPEDWLAGEFGSNADVVADDVARSSGCDKQERLLAKEARLLSQFNRFCDVWKTLTAGHP